MKTDPPMWIAAKFKGMSIPVDDNQGNSNKKLFLSKPVAVGYGIVKNPQYDNGNLGKEGYHNFSVEDCFERFINEMLEIETNMYNNFKNIIDIIPETIPKNYEEKICWSFERAFILLKRCSKCKNENLAVCGICKIVLRSLSFNRKIQRIST